MLPFLKKSQDASVSMPIEPVTRKPDDDSDYDGLHAAADDLIAAIHSKNTSGVAAALRAAFELCDSEPHEEGPHTTTEG